MRLLLKTLPRFKRSTQNTEDKMMMLTYKSLLFGFVGWSWWWSCRQLNWCETNNFLKWFNFLKFSKYEIWRSFSLVHFIVLRSSIIWLKEFLEICFFSSLKLNPLQVYYNSCSYTKRNWLFFNLIEFNHVHIMLFRCGLHFDVFISIALRE